MLSRGVKEEETKVKDERAGTYVRADIWTGA